jgi:hypothetical protein
VSLRGGTRTGLRLKVSVGDDERPADIADGFSFHRRTSGDLKQHIDDSLRLRLCRGKQLLDNLRAGRFPAHPEEGRE